MLKDNNINEPPSAFRGDAGKAKRDALPPDVKDYYLNTYNQQRNSNMRFKDDERPNLDNFNKTHNK